MLENLGGDELAHARRVSGKRSSVKATLLRFSNGPLLVLVPTLVRQRPNVVPSSIEDWPAHMAEFSDVIQV